MFEKDYDNEKKKKTFSPCWEKHFHWPWPLLITWNILPCRHRTSQTDERPDSSRLDHAASAMDPTLSAEQGSAERSSVGQGPVFSPTLSPLYLWHWLTNRTNSHRWSPPKPHSSSSKGDTTARREMEELGSEMSVRMSSRLLPPHAWCSTHC